jgi:Lrp/AsnC family transcriptional regulator for asnA, asnC and gidA
MVTRAKLDEKDEIIVKMLMENARTPLSDIAKELEISDVAVRKRVTKLEKMGVLLGYTAKVDPKALGYEVISLTGIDVESENLLAVAQEVANRPYARSVSVTTGDHAIMVEIWARDGDEMSKIIKEISDLPGVKRICPAIVMDFLKRKC